MEGSGDGDQRNGEQDDGEQAGKQRLRDDDAQWPRSSGRACSRYWLLCDGSGCCRCGQSAGSRTDAEFLPTYRGALGSFVNRDCCVARGLGGASLLLAKAQRRPGASRYGCFWFSWGRRGGGGFTRQGVSLKQNK